MMMMMMMIVLMMIDNLAGTLSCTYITSYYCVTIF